MDLRDRIISTLAGALVLACGAAQPADVQGAAAVTGRAAVLEWDALAAPLIVGPAGAAKVPALKPDDPAGFRVGSAPETCKPSPVDLEVRATPVRVGFFGGFFDALAKAWGDALNAVISQS